MFLFVSVYGYIGNSSGCPTDDMNPYDHCEPVNCIEKYFGSRNYFNRKLGICEKAVSCDNTNNMVSVSVLFCLSKIKLCFILNLILSELATHALLPRFC